MVVVVAGLLQPLGVVGVVEQVEVLVALQQLIKQALLAAFVPHYHLVEEQHQHPLMTTREQAALLEAQVLMLEARHI